MFYKSLEMLNMTIGSSKYLSWWHISDNFPYMIRECETMAKLVCKCSELKSDDYRFKHASSFMKSCSLCDHAACENAEHMIMACPYNSDLRTTLFNDLATLDLCKDIWEMVPAASTLKVILGGRLYSMEFNGRCPYLVYCCLIDTQNV